MHPRFFVCFFKNCGKIHITKFTILTINILKCIVQWHLVHLQCCTIITSNSRTFSSPQKETPHPMSSHSSFSPVLSSWQWLLCLLSLWICLLWIFHRNGIIRYMAFCTWLISLGIVLSSSFLLYFILSNISLYEYTHFLIHSSGDRYLGCSHFLAIVNHFFSVLLVIDLKVELRGHMVILYLTSWGNTNVSHRWLNHFTFPLAMHKVSNFSTSSPTHYFSYFWS